MKVSVVVPAYNEEKRIAKTLEGLKKQNYANYELIVVDNNSSDKTSEIAKKYTDKVFVETKQGYIHAVRRGAEEATGDLITFCDADSIYPNYWLYQVVHEFNKQPDAVAVYGTADTYDASPVQNFLNGFFYTQFLRLSRLLGLENTSGFNFVIKKSVYDQVGGYDPKYQKMSPDIELGKRVGKAGQIVFNPQIKVSSSFRRYQTGGTVQTQLMFFKSWWAMLKGHEPKLDYDAYNKAGSER